MMIAAILLAAGESRRMGQPKALLRVEDTTFIRHIIDELRSSHVERIIVVLGADAEDIRKEIQGFDIVQVFNQNFSEGQLSSVITGIEAAEALGAEAVIVHPVDHPLIRSTLVDELIKKFRESMAPVVVPVHEGRRGHPVLFGAQVFKELKQAPPEVGARAVVRTHEREIVQVETADDGILCNVDTQEAYGRLQENLRRSS